MKKFLMMLPVAAVLAGCGGGSPFSVWIVQSDTPNQQNHQNQATCNPAPTAPVTSTDTFTGEGSQSKWELYQGPKDTAGKETYYLNTGSEVLLGSKNGDTYTFNGDHTAVEQNNSNTPNANTVTSDTKVTITLTASGDAATGSRTDAQNISCTGACGTDFYSQNPSCTATSTFHARKLNDVELEHGV